MLEGWKNDPENFQTADEQFDKYMKFYNSCFERPDDFHLGIHLCRGNYVGSKHFSEGAYDRIAKKMFEDLNVSTYYLEYVHPWIEDRRGYLNHVAGQSTSQKHNGARS
jgi:hypothetical protein